MNDAHVSRATGRSTTRWRREHIADRRTVRRKCNRAQGHARCSDSLPRIAAARTPSLCSVAFRRAIRPREKVRGRTDSRTTHGNLPRHTRRFVSVNVGGPRASNVGAPPRDFPFTDRGMELARSAHPSQRSMNHAIEIEKGYFFFSPFSRRIRRRRCYSSLRIAVDLASPRSVGRTVEIATTYPGLMTSLTETVITSTTTRLGK